MKAYLLNAVGDVENLVPTEIDRPVPKTDEVLVEVKAISINPGIKPPSSGISGAQTESPCATPIMPTPEIT